MNCPIDGSELRITDRQGIEIDYCPQCRGVWLDRGELDKILERSAQPGYQSERQPIHEDDRSTRDQSSRDQGYGREEYGSQGHGKKRRSRSFLEDLLDFD
jgi:Zn-finger nucleic acid-binding protein